MSPTKDHVRERARELGLDLVGFARAQELDAHLPPDERVAHVSGTLHMVLVLGKHIFNGVSSARDPAQRQFACGLLVQTIESASRELGYWLEAQGQLASMLPSLIVDFTRERDATSNTPAGQGSHFLRTAAVQAGLGTWGLDMAVLTPQFGPRIFFGGLLTNLDVEPDPPLAGELCLGLEECGRCAAVCPEQAIPLTARDGLPLAQVRGLDGAACARSAHPYGPDAFVRHFKAIFDASGDARDSLIDSAVSRELWQGLAVSKQGAYTGCIECLQVCPVGADYAALQQARHCQDSLPGGVRHTASDGFVAVEHVGPAVRRDLGGSSLAGGPDLDDASR